jgi:hypothetical protein
VRPCLVESGGAGTEATPGADPARGRDDVEHEITVSSATRPDVSGEWSSLAIPPALGARSHFAPRPPPSGGGNAGLMNLLNPAPRPPSDHDRGLRLDLFILTQKHAPGTLFASQTKCPGLRGSGDRSCRSTGALSMAHTARPKRRSGRVQAGEVGDALPRVYPQANVAKAVGIESGPARWRIGRAVRSRHMIESFLTATAQFPLLLVTCVPISCTKEPGPVLSAGRRLHHPCYRQP